MENREKVESNSNSIPNTDMHVTDPVKSERKKKRFRMDGPDGGWAWCVALAACSVTFIIAGLARTSGILYVEFIRVFGVSREAAAYPSSIRSSTKNLLGPIVGILGQQYGVRPIVLAGGIIASASAAVCYFAWNMDFIVVLWGGFNGIGCALALTLLQVVIGQHFKKHTSTAAGLAFSGGCLGAFVLPVLIEYLLQKYGLQGTFLILCAIMMHIIPAAMILKKPAWLQQHADKSQTHGTVSPIIRSKSFETKSIDRNRKGSFACDSYPSDGIPNFSLVIELEDEESEHTEECTFSWYQRNKQLVLDVVYRLMRLKLCSEILDLMESDKEQDALNKNPISSKFPVPSWVESIVDEIYENGMKDDVQGKDADSKECLSSKTESPRDKVKNCFLNKMKQLESTSTPDILVSGLAIETKSNEIDIKSLLEEVCDVCSLYPETPQCKASDHTDAVVRDDNDNAVSKVQEPGDLHVKRNSKIILKSPQTTKIHKEGLKEHLKTALHLNYNPIFVLVCLCRIVHFIAFVPFVTVIVDFGIDKGIPEHDGKYIIAALSAGDLVGRVGFGWVTDRNCLSMPMFMLCAMIAHGAVTIMMPFVDAEPLLMFVVALFGMFEGAVFIRHPVMISKFLKPKEQSIAMGCINFVPGLIGFGLPSYIGYFRDTLGSYDNMFFITGAMSIAVGLLWLFEPQFKRCAPTDDHPENVQGGDSAAV